MRQEEVAAPEPPDSEILDLVQSLPKNYRLAIYLYYYVGYQVKKIAEMLGKTENTVSAYLSRGRKRLGGFLCSEQLMARSSQCASSRYFSIQTGMQASNSRMLFFGVGMSGALNARST